MSNLKNRQPLQVLLLNNKQKVDCNTQNAPQLTAKSKSADDFSLFIFHDLFSYNPPKMVALLKKIAATIIINLLLCLPGIYKPQWHSAVLCKISATKKKPSVIQAGCPFQQSNFAFSGSYFFQTLQICIYSGQFCTSFYNSNKKKKFGDNSSIALLYCSFHFVAFFGLFTKFLFKNVKITF